MILHVFPVDVFYCSICLVIVLQLTLFSTIICGKKKAQKVKVLKTDTNPSRLQQPGKSTQRTVIKSNKDKPNQDINTQDIFSNYGEWRVRTQRKSNKRHQNKPFPDPKDIYDEEVEGLYADNVEVKQRRVGFANKAQTIQIPHDQLPPHPLRKDRQIKNPYRKDYVIDKIKSIGGFIREKNTGNLVKVYRSKSTTNTEPQLAPVASPTGSGKRNPEIPAKPVPVKIPTGQNKSG